LTGPIDAGTWRIVADAIVWVDCDLQFDLVWHQAGGAESTIVSFTHHYAPQPDHPDGTANFDAVPYEETAAVAAVPAKAGDQLIWRFTLSGTEAQVAWAPNGDGAIAKGRIPFIELP
jgi:hypothetical protein